MVDVALAPADSPLSRPSIAALTAERPCVSLLVDIADGGARSMAVGSSRGRGRPSSSVCSAERLPRQRVMQALPPARPHQTGRFNIVAPPAADVAPITRRQRLWSEMANHELSNC